MLSTYDNEDLTREQVAKRYRVSVGMVKKLFRQRRHTGDIGSRRHLCGRKPQILESHRSRMRELRAKTPDMTLAELREAVGLDCTLPKIHSVLEDMGLSFTKRLSMPANKIAKTSQRPGCGGVAGKGAETPPGSCSWMSRRPRPT
jgi:transposase